MGTSRSNTDINIHIPDVYKNFKQINKFVVVDPDVRGKEVAQKMLRLAVKQAFDNPEAERVQLNVFPENPRAKRCYEKAGFVVRNFTPDAFTYKDETWGRCNMVFNKE